MTGQVLASKLNWTAQCESFQLSWVLHNRSLKKHWSEMGKSVGSQKVAYLAQVRNGKPDGLPKGRVFGTVAY